MSLPNVPAGWSAFRVLRQAPERVRPVLHGNWKHGARSKRVLAEMRELRFLLRIADSPRVLARVPDCVLRRLFPPRPMGWGGYIIGRKACGTGAAEMGPAGPLGVREK